MNAAVVLRSHHQVPFPEVFLGRRGGRLGEVPYLACRQLFLRRLSEEGF
jgi:hypothetical protein